MLRRKTYNLTIAPRDGSPRPSNLLRTPTVKFQPDHLDGVNTIARHDATGIWVAGQVHRGSVVVPWVGAIQPWPPQHFDALTQAHFDQLLDLQPELVIFGSGVRLRFVAAPLIRRLVERSIGFEVMDSAAACRTFNVLVSEKRSVVAALLLDSAPV